LPLQTPLGTTVSLGALGRVTLGAAEARSLAAVDGEPAVMLSVRKRADGNTIAVVEAVDEALHVLAPSLPPGVAVVTVRDGSAFIEASVEAVWEALIIGGVLAVGVIWLFLRDWRATLIGGLAMPLSVVAAFTFMQLAGFSFNLLSTLALSLAIGILVDDAVVDLENIHRHIQAGEPPLEAAINATGEIQLAVTATTLTIVAVFVPVAFMDGMIGQFFKEFGLTVAFSVLISLLVARTLTPMLAARFHGGQLPAESADGRLERAYSRLLAWCLDHRRATVALGLATLALALALVPMIPKGFMTTADRGEFNLILELPPGASLETTAARADAVVEVLKRRPEVRHAFTQIGEGGAVDRALIGVELVERRARRLTDRQLARAVLPELRAVPGVAIRVEEIGMMGQSEQNLPLLVVLKGEDLTALERHAGEIARALAGAGGFVDVDTTAGRPRAELVARIDHARAAERGVNPALLAKTLRLATSGEVASRLNVAGEEIDVRVRAARSQRAADERLGALTVPARGGGLVRLDAVARVTREAGMTAIDHRDRSRTVAVTATLSPGYSVGDAPARAEALVAGLALPGSVEAAFLGQAEWMHETFGSLQGALLLAVVFIYMILATQSESFLHPLTIMLALPLSLSGAFLALFLGGKELGLVSMIGLIMLMGLVTKNGILLVDFTLQKQREGRSARRALLAAAPLRLRPILMTSTAMIFGMAPIAFEFGAASEFRSPMGIVVVGGLLTSTLLTLFVVPVVFSLFDDLARRLAGRPVAGHADA
ncbi:MAG: efflux RND transporter permease subunit, partial [Candidatus Sericytochromatia bacterium]